MQQDIDLTKINAIIFDLGGVVLNIDYDLTIKAFKELGKDNFDDLYTQAHQNKVFDKFETGLISASEFVKYLQKHLPQSDEQTIINAWNAMLLDLPEHRIELLKALKEKYDIFLFSNTNEIHFKSFRDYIENKYGDRDLLENLFLQTYYSHKVNKRKPNADAFQKVLEDHTLNPEKTLFIDDSEQHIKGAKKIGLNTYHLKNADIATIFN